MVTDGFINWSSILQQLVIVSEAAVFPSNSGYWRANNIQVGMLPEEWKENQSLSPWYFSFYKNAINWESGLRHCWDEKSALFNIIY